MKNFPARSLPATQPVNVPPMSARDWVGVQAGDIGQLCKAILN